LGGGAKICFKLIGIILGLMVWLVGIIIFLAAIVTIFTIATSKG
jgi:hypothetical protein